MYPSVGRIVHYVSYGTPKGEFAPACRAAVITDVDDEQTVSLAVLNPQGLFFDVDLEYDEGRKPGSWHWPERVED